MAWQVDGFDPVGRLGSGPTGGVVKAHDTSSGTAVAIKYLSKDVADGPGFADTFRTDGAALTQIDSPHIAQVYGHVAEARGAAVVTEFVDGVTLRTLLDRDGALEPQAALYVVKGALTGLAEAHRRGVTHRNVTPGNLIIDRTGVPKVLDFGVAARFRRNAPSPGNPRYLAPELWLGRPATPASDVFATMAVLLEALTGAPPASPDGGFIGNAALAASEKPKVAAIDAVPDRIRDVVVRGLAPQASARYANAAAAADALVFAALRTYGFDWESEGRQQLLARMNRPAAPAVVPSRRRVRTWAAVIAAVVVVATAAYVVANGGHGHPTASATASPAPTPAPIPQPGSSVPAATPSPNATSPDTTSPQQPVGLRITSRSQTAITLEWTPARDNVQVVSYRVTRNHHPVGTTTVPGYTDTSLIPNTTYEYSVTALDEVGNASPASSTAIGSTLGVPDTSPPTVPTGLHSTGQTTTKIVLAWKPARDNVGVAGYDVIRDGVRVASVAQPGFADIGLSADTSYTYTVRAYDATRNVSHDSAPMTVSTLTASDTTPPTAPAHVTATAETAGTIHVAWSAGTDNVGVIGYQIFRDGVQVATSTNLTYDDYGLTASTTYHYTIRSVDAAMLPSPPSPEASATTDPAPTPSPTPSSDEPPTPAVTDIQLTASAVSTTTCTTMLTATVTATGGLYSADVLFSVDGVDLPTATVVFDSNGNGYATLSGVDGTSNGTATATVVGTAYTDDAAWTAPDECIPQTIPLDPPGVTPSGAG